MAPWKGIKLEQKLPEWMQRKWERGGCWKDMKEEMK